MPRSESYICPRCRYSTPLKKSMRKHLYDLKNPCPNKTNIDMTDEIKEMVIRDHYYHDNNIVKSEPLIQVNYNPQNTYVNGMETFRKLTQYLEYNQKKIIDINDFVENQHQETVEKLERDEFKKPHLLESEQFLGLIDDMVKTNDYCHEEMNIVYDELLDRIKIWCDGEWTTFMIESGLRRLVQILRTNYLDPYECYLYMKIFSDKRINGYDLNTVRIRLEEYYKFLAIFDHHPYVYTEPIEYVISSYKTDNPDEFRDYGMPRYNKLKEELTKQEINKLKKSVLDIVKRNNKLNLKKLNESISELINVDQEFKNSLMMQNKSYLGLSKPQT